MHALILAGGSGTRFWPLSRRARPKQFLALDGERSLLQATVDRLAPLIGPENVWVSTTVALRDLVVAQLPEVPVEQILAEPMGRNTAPAIGWALQCMSQAAQTGVVAVLPADHRIERGTDFRTSLAAAGDTVATRDCVMTLGVRPSRIETGYGYLEQGEALEGAEGLCRVARFTEKPNREDAQRFVDSGTYLWNAGIFVFNTDTLLGHLARLEPAIGKGLAAIKGEPERTPELYAELPSISIDYAVMERLDDIATLPLDCGWSDLGSWTALSEILEQDEQGNAVKGDTLAIDAADNVVVADAGHVALVGVSGLVVVRTADSVLVMPKDRDQDVKAIVESLRSAERMDLL